MKEVLVIGTKTPLLLEAMSRAYPGDIVHVVESYAAAHQLLRERPDISAGAVMEPMPEPADVSLAAVAGMLKEIQYFVPRNTSAAEKDGHMFITLPPNGAFTLTSKPRKEPLQWGGRFRIPDPTRHDKRKAQKMARKRQRSRK